MGDATETEETAEAPKERDRISHGLCGWCGSGSHRKCEERGGYIMFTQGVHDGLQCKCHDQDHLYEIERSAPKDHKPSAKRKTRR